LFSVARTKSVLSFLHVIELDDPLISSLSFSGPSQSSLFVLLVPQWSLHMAPDSRMHQRILEDSFVHKRPSICTIYLLCIFKGILLDLSLLRSSNSDRSVFKGCQQYLQMNEPVAKSFHLRTYLGLALSIFNLATRDTLAIATRGPRGHVSSMQLHAGTCMNMARIWRSDHPSNLENKFCESRIPGFYIFQRLPLPLVLHWMPRSSLASRVNGSLFSSGFLLLLSRSTVDTAPAERFRCPHDLFLSKPSLERIGTINSN